MSILRVSGLTTQFLTRTGVVRAVDKVSFAVNAGESVGLVGESGSGKTVASLSLLRLAEGAEIIAGSVEWDGVDLLGLPERDLLRVRGRDISMVFQEPSSSLNPVYTVGDQIGEVLVVHEGMSFDAARSRTEELLTRVGISDPSVRIDAYPHQLSGGMKQRVMLAMALACNPRLLIADEPTTALDVTVQAQIMELLATERRDQGMAMLLISHDLALVSENCSQVVVMYAGQVVEAGTVEDVLTEPWHPYTDGLLRSLPERAQPGEPLFTIPGSIPPAALWDEGCRFRARCPRASERCAAAPPWQDERVRCWHPLEPRE
ncbi:MAG: ABC transporter ATP-binding protein [Myxococcota bacterium]